MKNDALKMDYVSFGGFKFSKNMKQSRKFKIKEKPHFKNIVVYGNSDIIETDYYILLNNSKIVLNFEYKDTIIDSQKMTLTVKKSANRINKIFC